MIYEKPKMEIVVMCLKDVVTLSVEGGGSGDDTKGPWE